MEGVALALVYLGGGSLSLAMPKHARELWPGRELSNITRKVLRSGGALLLVLALCVCVAGRGWLTGFVYFFGLITVGMFALVLTLAYLSRRSASAPQRRSYTSATAYRQRFPHARWRAGVAFLAVVLLHGAAIGAVLWVPAPKTEKLVLPSIQGILVPAPPAEQVQMPSAAETPPPPDPAVAEPEPKPEPVKPKPKPKPKPNPVKLPPSEKAITRPKEVEETPPERPKPPPRPSAPEAEVNNTLGAPVTPPRHDANPLNNPAPAYPVLSRRLREEGVVILEVLILPDGSVGEVRIKESSGYERLDETAMEAVRQWSYLPARRGDKAIAYWYLQPLEFSLN